MKKYHFNKIIVFAMMASVAGIFIGAKNVSAADGVTTSMFVTPMSQEILLVPGEEYSGAISISNAAEATDDLIYSTKVGSYNRAHSEENDDDYGAVDVETKTERNAIVDWITLSKEGGTVSPNGSDQFKYTIRVPENAPAGAQYASILVIDETDSGEDNKEGVSIRSKLQTASAIIANIAGESIERGSILDNSFPSIITNGALEASSLVKNDGNVYTNAEYVLQVWPLFSGEEICTNEEEPETSLILPDTERYHTQTCNLPRIGVFKVKQTVRIFGEISEVEKMIVYCPLWLMFVIVAVIVGLIIWLIMRSKSRKK